MTRPPCPVRGWRLAGLLLVLCVAAWSLPLGARPADDVSSVLPALRPATSDLGPRATELASRIVGPDHHAPLSGRSVLAPLLVTAAAIVVLVLLLAPLSGPRPTSAVARVGRGRAPPRT